MRRIKSRTVGECPCEYALRYIGGAWKILIVVILDRAKIRRYGELKRVLRGITHKMLAQQLREMERDGLIARTVYAEVPPKVEPTHAVRRDASSRHRRYVDLGQTNPGSGLTRGMLLRFVPLERLPLFPCDQL